MNTIKVTCAIIEFKNKILAVQRSEKMDLPFKWEFPGGKLKSNESLEECIKREIREELSISIETKAKLNSSIYKYPHILIELIPFVAKLNFGNLTLKEHRDFKWCTKEDLMDLDWAEADIPILKNYLEL